ncbi:MAG TPA: hypothetical protein VFR10_13120, partial [bacterium]|nr:hypothetical protein [bacterium]
MFGAAAGLVEIFASRAETLLRIPFLIGADGVLGMALGTMLAVVFMHLRKKRGEEVALAGVVGALVALGMAAFLGI